jgi:putative oxidoreductase
MIRRIHALHQSVVNLLNTLQSPLLLAIRLYFGIQLSYAGWGKLHSIDKVTDFFTSLNLPMPHQTAIFVALVEFLGGIFFALGLGSRIVSFILFINMTVAYWTADREAFGQIFSDPDKFVAAAPYVFWFASLLILILGPGALAFDWLLARATVKRIAD